MFARFQRGGGRRRGVVLVVILGMLGLLALIGVTFATFSGQARIGARNFALAQVFPDSTEVMDYGLSQLIGDTGNPMSALRGHSLLRDMYGNDTKYNGFLPGIQLGFAVASVSGNTVTTNIPSPSTNSAMYGYDFTRWIMKVPAVPAAPAAGRSMEVLVDDYSSNVHVFTVGYFDGATVLNNEYTGGVGMVPIQPGTTFDLDGRYLHAFNGPGMGANAVYGNFRTNYGAITGTDVPFPGDPNAVGMDEDYDACDLENWYLAIQSADGQIMVPSFHRPGIIRIDPANPTTAGTNDWLNTGSSAAMSRILRPRQIDGHSTLSFPDLTPDPATGKLTFDVDNDGDGQTDSVWLDLGYPPKRDAVGTLFKPLYAFMVIGLNGRLPLNTAGNLSGGSNINPSHTAHLGNSPSEINPLYALQNAWDPTGLQYAQGDNTPTPLSTYSTPSPGPQNVALTQFRNVLTGTCPPDGGKTNFDTNYVLVNGQQWPLPNNLADPTDSPSNGPVFRLTTPVAGRWGEAQFVPGGGVQPLVPNPNPIITNNSMGNPIAADNTYFGNRVRAGYSGLYLDPVSGTYQVLDAGDDNYNTFDINGTQGEVNNFDTLDAVGGFLLPVERMRRFVYPTDLTGHGRINTYNRNSQLGADPFGRVVFHEYVRPPGSPSILNANTPPTPRSSGAVAADNTNNQYHGYESYRMPKLAVSGQNWHDGGMPWNLNGGTTVPTYNVGVNSGLNNDLMNEANEMNLYTPNATDQPFGPGDLEWLYRLQDSDGASLSSRLSTLAPISFLNPSDGPRRRRLFALDSWDLNTYCWSTDNPGGVFANNSNFGPLANAGFLTANLPTPILAHGDHKINLNYPLPVSNDPDELVRRKWVTDAYYLFKAVLPPKAVDTPYELAQLSQYLLNVIDFRDPDATMTHWQNPDVKLVPVTESAIPKTSPVAYTYTPPYLVPAAGAPATAVALDQYGMEYNPIALNEVLAYSFTYRDDGGKPPPPNQKGTPKQVNRLFVELANTLSDSQTGAAPTSLDLNNWQVVVLPDDARGRPDPVTGQIPNLGTGAAAVPLLYPPVPTGVTKPTNYPTGLPIQPLPISGTLGTGLGTALPPLSSPPYNSATLGADTTGNYYYLLETPDPWAADPTNNPQPQTNGKAIEGGTVPIAVTRLPNNVLYQLPMYPPNPNSATPLSKTSTPPVSSYFWLYLLRPANPFDNTSAAVVVDSFRFAFTEGGGVVKPDSDTMNHKDTVTPGTNALYSLQRLQPYRGGQAVPMDTAANAYATTPGTPTPYFPVDAYGYTEQTAPATGGSTFQGYYGDGNTQDKPASKGPAVTANIYHTLGAKNSPLDPAWDFFPFHDRDFSNVAELLFVPGCAPGLFTKKFTEFVPNTTWTTPTPLWAPDPTTVPSAAPNIGTAYPPIFVTPPPPPPPPPANPHTFPYLVDNFFYSGQSEVAPTDNAGPPAPVAPFVGGPSSAGWFKMLEFLEVPSPTFGAIGPVAQGLNFDWYRQDRKPGQLNLNLIIDEEVFYGLFSDQVVLNDLQLDASSSNPNPQNPLALAYQQVPQVATMATYPTPGNNNDQRPSYAYGMNNQGFADPYTYWDSASSSILTWTGNSLKAGFTDFLKLRHGGSGYLFAFGGGPTGTPNTALNPKVLAVAADRPFRSLSFPDINYTIFRPATLPPSPDTTPALNTNTASPPLVLDPGVKNAYYPGYAVAYGMNQLPPTATSPFAGVLIPTAPPSAPPGTASGTAPGTPPPIPARRLFQIPDKNGNASILGDPINVNTPTLDNNLSLPGTSLVTPPLQDTMGNVKQSYELGGAVGAGISSPGPPPSITLPDMRQHPYFRYDWLQKVTNLTTVRTHQYAVWITVGFFEVSRQGDPQLAASNYTLAMDILGAELNSTNGHLVRYRSFFLLDRTRAFGFDPSNPGDFRSVVVYRQLIE